MVTAGATVVLMSALFAAHTNVVVLQVPPLPQSVFAVQFVVHLPDTHEPASAPGQVASPEHAAAAGPANGPDGPFGEAQIEVTYPNEPWIAIESSWFGKHPAVPPL